MSIHIDLNDRMFAAFGFIPTGIPQKAVIYSGIVDAYANDVAMNIGTDRANIGIIKSNIGANVFVADRSFADLTLRSTVDGTMYKFANTGLSESLSDILAPSPMISFSRDKKIVETSVDGSDAVVVESFGLKQWNITIEGILVDMNEHHYPWVQLRELKKMFETNAMFDVLDCEILDDLDIRSLYIDKMESLKFVEGYNDTIKYTLKAKSMQPIEFFL